MTRRTLVPDLLVVCGELEPSTLDPNAIVNAVAVVEVLSPSTEDYDLGAKLHHYRRLPTLKEYVTVAQDRRWISTARRGAGDLWAFDDVFEGRFAVAGIEVAVDDAYRDEPGVIVEPSPEPMMFR